MPWGDLTPPGNLGSLIRRKSLSPLTCYGRGAGPSRTRYLTPTMLRRLHLTRQRTLLGR